MRSTADSVGCRAGRDRGRRRPGARPRVRQAVRGRSRGLVVADIDGTNATETAEAIAAELPSARVLPIAVDVADATSTVDMARAARNELGDIGILVNNAGIWVDLEPAPVMELAPDYWDRVLAVNLKGPLLCSQAVVSISSMGAHMSDGITVNAVARDLIDNVSAGIGGCVSGSEDAPPSGKARLRCGCRGGCPPRSWPGCRPW